MVETGLGNLCGNGNKTMKTGQEGADNVQVWKKKSQWP